MEFWVDKVASFQSTITMKRTAGEVVAGTQRIAKKFVLDNARNPTHSVRDH